MFSPYNQLFCYVFPLSWVLWRDREFNHGAYEFYRRNSKGKEHLIGILPEKRKNSDRITTESIMNWVRKMLGGNPDAKNVFFTEVEV